MKKVWVAGLVAVMVVCAAGISLADEMMAKEGTATEEAMMECPVCGAPAAAEIGEEYEGTMYNFCSEECKDTFLAAPEEYKQMN